MIRQTGAVMIMAAALGLAQEKAPPAPQPTERRVQVHAERVQKVFQIKHADVERLAEALRIFCDTKYDKSLGILVVAGSPSAVAAADEAVSRLDVPAPAEKNLDLTFHIIQAGLAGEKPLPKDLDGVARNLASLFGHTSFQLLETVVIRCRDGHEINNQGQIPYARNPPTSAKITYNISARPSLTGRTEKGSAIRIDRLGMSLRFPNFHQSDPNRWEMLEGIIRTQLDVREGQKVVVGKTNTGTVDGIIFLVVTAKVVE